MLYVSALTRLSMWTLTNCGGKRNIFVQSWVCYRFSSGRFGGWEWRRNVDVASASNSGRRSRWLEEARWAWRARATIRANERSIVQRYQEIFKGFGSDNEMGRAGLVRPETSITMFVYGRISFVVRNLICKGTCICPAQMDICGWMCTLVVYGRLKQHVDAWVYMGMSSWLRACRIQHRHVGLDHEWGTNFRMNRGYGW